jgi:hypothetical protein
MAFSQKGGTVQILDTASHANVTTLQVTADDRAPMIAWSPDGSRLGVAADAPDVAQLFDTTTWASVGGPLAGPAATVSPAAPAASAAESASASAESTPGAFASPQPSTPNAGMALAFSPDSSTLLVGAADGNIWMWDARSGAPHGVPLVTGNVANALSVNPTNGWIAENWSVTGGRSSVYRPGDSSPVYTVDVDGDYGVPRAVAFSPDGKILATGGGIGKVRLWDAMTGAPIGHDLLVAAGWVDSLDWSDDSTELAVGGEDGTVRLIDVAPETVGWDLSGAAIGDPSADTAAALSSDGSHLFVGYSDGRIEEWSLDPTEWEAKACSVANRQLTQVEWDQYLPGQPYDSACSATVDTGNAPTASPSPAASPTPGG